MAVYYYGLEQNTDEWHEARGGILTASGSAKVLTPKFAMSASRWDYIGKLLSFGLEETENFYSDDMQEGHNREPRAIAEYELVKGTTVTPCGIVYKDYSYNISCSPDGLVSDEGGLELKNPLLSTHISTIAKNEIPAKYLTQLYFSLYVTGRDWWDFVSYHPQAKLFSKRVYKDDEITIGKQTHLILDLIDVRAREFLNDLEKARQKAFY